ncbi:MAG TPA: hypothetical protein VFL96_09820 [Acidobacteriaceae bacterium]|jgi:hypothetical protein|nr:hypothetical protein [Acidobacteriaceae bacterium]
MKTIKAHYFRELTPERRPQDPMMDGKGWTFETLEHGGEYDDAMPQAIRATDAQGRCCVYVPVMECGRVVDSLGYTLHYEPDEGEESPRQENSTECGRRLRLVPTRPDGR